MIQMINQKSKSAKISVGLLSLGCPKTLVDSELILGGIDAQKYRITYDMSSCDVAVLNTCSFIEEAKQESIDHILKLAEMKKAGRIKAIVVLGCLVQRYQKELTDALREVDAFLGTGDYQDITNVIDQVMDRKKISMVSRSPGFLYTAQMNRIALTEPHYRYIKISEGCDHICTFCTIPSYRGKHRSRQIDDIVKEAHHLVDQGARELVLTGQDTTFFGYDTHQKFLLKDLLKALNKISDLKWIRLLYAYPSFVNDDLIDAIVDYDKVCHYLDIPLQHVSDKILKAMKRGLNKQTTYRLIQKLRKKIPDLSIRTTFIVGFPGEGDSEYAELLAFMRESQFERLGMFTYSREEGSPAAEIDNQVPESVKLERYNEGMALQQSISEKNNLKLLNHSFEVMIEKQSEENPEQFIGRTYMDAPDVDGLIYVNTPKHVKLKSGSFVSAKVIRAKEYDLEADYQNVCQ